MTTGLDVLLLSEDSGGQMEATWTAVFRKMCRELEPDCQTHRVRIRSAKGEPQRAMRGNAWKGADRRSEALRRLMVRAITTYLRTGGIVVFHFDGDTPWSERHQCPHKGPYT